MFKAKPNKKEIAVISEITTPLYEKISVWTFLRIEKENFYLADIPKVCSEKTRLNCHSFPKSASWW